MSPLLDTLLRVAALCAGAVLVYFTVMSAIRTFVLPRSDNVWLTRMVFRNVLKPFRFRANRAKNYADRDRLLALYAPVALLSLPVVWLFLINISYMLMFWAIGVGSLYDAFKASESSLFTLGYFFPLDTPVAVALLFTEAVIGLGMTALLISYLPTMYNTFQKRETLVTLLEVRADSPPSPITMIVRAHGIRGLESLTELWEAWEVWFAEIDESHTSLAAINFFRSPQPDRSWITAAGAVLDCASLMTSVVDVPRTPEAQLCIRAGFVALRHIGDFFRIPYHADPHFPDQPVSISREEFDDACAQLEAAGVPLVADRDQAWQDFAGWRVNYDTVLLTLSELLMAPYAMWSSDRGVSRTRLSR